MPVLGIFKFRIKTNGESKMKKIYLILIFGLLLISLGLNAMEEEICDMDTSAEQQNEITIAVQVNNSKKRKRKFNRTHHTPQKLTKRRKAFIAKECAEEVSEKNLQADWNILPDELKVYILSFVLNTDDAISAINVKNCKAIASILRQYATLRFTSKNISALALDEKLFNLDMIIVSMGKYDRLYVLPILKNAAIVGCVNTLKLLSKNGIIWKDSPIDSIIAIASQNGHIKFCEELILNGIFKGTNIALVRAIYLHKYNKVQNLIEKGKMKASLDGKFNELMIAASVGDMVILALLLDANSSDINNKDVDGWTALMFASRYGHKDIVELLLERGTVIDEKNNRGSTPLMIASAYGHKDVVKLLLYNKAAVDERNSGGSTALMYASMNGHKNIVKLLLYNKAGVDKKNYGGSASIMLAADNGHKDIVELLLCNKAALDEKNSAGSTPLMLASGKGHAAVVELLLAKGAGFDKKNIEGMTPLMIASVNGHKDIVELLLAAGADANIVGRVKNALTFAKIKGRADIYELLQEQSDRLSKH